VDIAGKSIVVAGGASGLGLATAERLAAAGGRVTIVDLPQSDGKAQAKRLGGDTRFATADVTDAQQLTEALDVAAGNGPLRAVVHTAGRGARIRLTTKAGEPGDLGQFKTVVDLNIVGSYNILRLAASRMATQDALDGERGVIVLTASVAAFEGQIGQIAYAAAKAGIVGMTITAARDLASAGVRVCTIAPGIFDTPLVAKGLRSDIIEGLRASVPFPRRLGTPPEYAALAEHIIGNSYLNGETIRLDGAIRMAPR
jgi:NAD(P)-dependent dehydrogenase (short-subunit alcohol dehydrogenase family)